MSVKLTGVSAAMLGRKSALVITAGTSIVNSSAAKAGLVNKRPISDKRLVIGFKGHPFYIYIIKRTGEISSRSEVNLESQKTSERQKTKLLW
ncbi:MAG: hypothetical protein ACI9T7_003502 [Oleiphilaceae bacterium]